MDKLKTAVSIALKVAFSASMLGFLAWQAYHDDQFWRLVREPKDWLVLAAAAPVGLAAVTITILRWHMLIRTLGLRMALGETLRAGFLGYLVNLMPLGLVGGDSLKAVMLIHREPRRKTEAVATVLVDRVLGLYALLLLAAIGSFVLPLHLLSGSDRALVARLCLVVRMASLIGTVGLGVMLVPSVTESRWWDRLEHTPALGKVLHKLVGAMRTYRRSVHKLLAAIGLSLIVHLLYVALIVVLAAGLRVPTGHRPALGMHFVIVPLAMISGALPIGAFEVTLNVLYHSVAPGGSPPNLGFLLALGYRVVQILIASIGLGYWLAGRREVSELIHEAEEHPVAEEVGDDQPAAVGAINPGNARR